MSSDFLTALGYGERNLADLTHRYESSFNADSELNQTLKLQIQALFKQVADQVGQVKQNYTQNENHYYGFSYQVAKWAHLVVSSGNSDLINNCREIVEFFIDQKIPLKKQGFPDSTYEFVAPMCMLRHQDLNLKYHVLQKSSGSIERVINPMMHMMLKGYGASMSAALIRDLLTSPNTFCATAEFDPLGTVGFGFGSLLKIKRTDTSFYIFHQWLILRRQDMGSFHMSEELLAMEEQVQGAFKGKDIQFFTGFIPNGRLGFLNKADSLIEIDQGTDYLFKERGVLYGKKNGDTRHAAPSLKEVEDARWALLKELRSSVSLTLGFKASCAVL